MGIIGNKAFSNPFYRTSSLEILFFFAGWGIWWSFFQIWLTTNQGFTGAQVGQIVFSTPLGALHDNIGYQNTFLAISGIVCVATIYAFFILKKDDQDVYGQPLN